MSNANYKQGNNQNSSGSTSSTSSSMDLKNVNKRKDEKHHANVNGRTRSSFLHCLGKRLGRHFQQHQIHQQRSESGRIQNVLAVYNSEEDIHSSSTDSFSLSYERYGGTQSHNFHRINSSIDLTGEERSSGTSSAASAYSRYSTVAFKPANNDVWPKRQSRRHSYVETNNMYRRTVRELEQFSNDEYSDNSQGDGNGNEADVDNDNNENDDSEDDNIHTIRIAAVSAKHQQNYENNIKRMPNKKKSSSIITKIKSKYNKSNSNITATTATTTANTSPAHSHSNSRSRSRSTSPTSSMTKGLHLSRISIASSVCRMFQHFNINSTSIRSLSCNSTPLRGKFQVDNKKTTINKNNNQIKTRCHSKRSSSTVNASTTTTTHLRAKSSNISIISSNSKKKEKKQQSILRPPVSYVYMKGMSGLYSRVPRYTVYCPYAMHQTA